MINPNLLAGAKLLARAQVNFPQTTDFEWSLTADGGIVHCTSTIDNSVIGSGAIIGPGGVVRNSRVANSIIGSSTIVRCSVLDSTVHDTSISGSVTTVFNSHISPPNGGSLEIRNLGSIGDSKIDWLGTIEGNLSININRSTMYSPFVAFDINLINDVYNERIEPATNWGNRSISLSRGSTRTPTLNPQMSVTGEGFTSTYGATYIPHPSEVDTILRDHESNKVDRLVEKFGLNKDKVNQAFIEWKVYPSITKFMETIRGS
jgi:hypothetical protein